VDGRIKTRLVGACAFLLILLCLLSGRLVWIEMVKGGALATEARAHYEYEMVLPAKRGRIFDGNGDLLARNQTVYTLKVDCHHLRDLGLACIGLARKEGVSAQAIRRKYLPAEIRSVYRGHVVECLSAPLRIPKHTFGRELNSKETGEIILAKQLEEDFARQIEVLLEENSLGGLYLERGQRRYYPSPRSLTHVIGYVNAENEGMEGVEKVFDDEMRGRPGIRYCERDRRRRELRAYRGKHVEPVPGNDVHLTIDMALQYHVESALDGVMEAFGPEKVSSVWLRPRTGEVVAMASRPHFDLDSREGNRRNIAISDLYQPGSTFKIVAFGGAFDRGLILPSTPVDCHMGLYNLEGFELKDHHDYGVIPAEKAFAKSSNIGAYLVARPLNPHVFHYYMRQFGFGEASGIELTAENDGTVYPVSEWTTTSFSSAVMGYEVAVTPLQMAAACGIIANDGIYQAPTVVKKVVDHEGIERDLGEARVTRRVISERAARQVKRCMVAVLEEGGTGTKAAIPGYTIAGKTGTARKHVVNVGYVSGRYVVSFMGFFPADDPELVGIVMIDDPRADGIHLYGGTIAAPVFREIAEKAIRLYGMEPDKPEELLPEADQTEERDSPPDLSLRASTREGVTTP